MGNWLENAYGSFWHEATKGAAKKAAASICVDLEFMPDWNLSGAQLDLFHAFLAECIVKQESGQDSYMARRPDVNAARQVPIIGAVINALVFIPDRVNGVVVSELEEEARAKRLKLVYKAKDEILKALLGDDLSWVLGERNTNPLFQVVEEIAEQGVDLWLKPRPILRAANLMASAYTVHKAGSRERLIVALKQTEQSIASWEDWDKK